MNWLKKKEGKWTKFSTFLSSLDQQHADFLGASVEGVLHPQPSSFSALAVASATQQASELTGAGPPQQLSEAVLIAFFNVSVFIHISSP